MLSVIITNKERRKKERQGGGWRFLEEINMFTALIVVMLSQVYIYLQTHQVVYLNMDSFL